MMHNVTIEPYTPLIIGNLFKSRFLHEYTSDGRVVYPVYCLAAEPANRDNPNMTSSEAIRGSNSRGIQQLINLHRNITDGLLLLPIMKIAPSASVHYILAVANIQNGRADITFVSSTDEYQKRSHKEILDEYHRNGIFALLETSGFNISHIQLQTGIQQASKAGSGIACLVNAENALKPNGVTPYALTTEDEHRLYQEQMQSTHTPNENTSYKVFFCHSTDNTPLFHKIFTTVCNHLIENNQNTHQNRLMARELLTTYEGALPEGVTGHSIAKAICLSSNVNSALNYMHEQQAPSGTFSP